MPPFDLTATSVLLPSAALLAVCGWCLKSAVRLLWELDHRVTVIETKLGIARET